MKISDPTPAAKSPGTKTSAIEHPGWGDYLAKRSRPVADLGRPLVGGRLKEPMPPLGHAGPQDSRTHRQLAYTDSCIVLQAMLADGGDAATLAGSPVARQRACVTRSST